MTAGAVRKALCRREARRTHGCDKEHDQHLRTGCNVALQSTVRTGPAVAWLHGRLAQALNCGACLLLSSVLLSGLHTKL